MKQQDTDAVRALLKQQVDVNTPQADGATALHWAAHRDDLTAADLLIRAGANVNAAKMMAAFSHFGPSTTSVSGSDRIRNKPVKRKVINAIASKA